MPLAAAAVLLAHSPHPLPHALLPQFLRLLASLGRYNRVQAAIELGYIESARFVEALHEAASAIASARSSMLTLCPLPRPG